MKRIVRLTESDLVKLVKRVIKEQGHSIHNMSSTPTPTKPKHNKYGYEDKFDLRGMPISCNDDLNSKCYTNARRHILKTMLPNIDWEWSIKEQSVVDSPGEDWEFDEQKSPEYIKSEKIEKQFADISTNIAKICGCLKGGAEHYLQTWNDSSLLSYIRKIDSKLLFDAVNMYLGCVMKGRGWGNDLGTNYEKSLDVLVNSFAINTNNKDNILYMKDVIKKYK
jgi:hypothetical protein